VDRNVHANDGIAGQVVVQHPWQAPDNLDLAQREANRERAKVQGMFGCPTVCVKDCGLHNQKH